MPSFDHIHVHVHRGTRDAATAHDPKTGRFASASHHISMHAKHKNIAESGSVRGTAQEAPHREAMESHETARVAHEGYRLNRFKKSEEANAKSDDLGVSSGRAKDSADPSGKLSATTRRS